MDEQLNEVGSHEHSKGQEVKPSQLFRQAFVVAGQPAETSHPCEAALYYPPAGQQHKPSLGIRQLDHLQPDALLLGSLGSVVTRVALVYKCYFYRAACHFLHLLRQLLHLCSLPLTGCCNTQGQQVAESVYRQMYLAPLAALGSVVACSCATLGTGLHRAAVEYGRRRLRVAPAC